MVQILNEPVRPADVVIEIAVRVSSSIRAWRQAGGGAELALIMRTYGTLPKHQTKHRRNGNDPNRLYFS